MVGGKIAELTSVGSVIPVIHMSRTLNCDHVRHADTYEKEQDEIVIS